MLNNEFDMDPEEQQELIVEFLTESDGHIQVLNENLLKAEEAIKAQTEMSDADMNAMFRAAHTIKGTASFFGLTKTVSLTHEMETILQKVKNREMVLTSGIIDVLFKAFDTLESLFVSLRESKTEDADITESVELIRAILTGPQPAQPSETPPVEKTAEPAPPPAEADTPQNDTIPAEEQEPINEKYVSQYVIETAGNIEEVNRILVALDEDIHNEKLISELFRMTHTIKGSSGLINAHAIADVAHAMENCLSLVREHNTILDGDTISVLFKGIDIIKELVDQLATTRRYSSDTKPMLTMLGDLYNTLEVKAAATADRKETETASGKDADSGPLNVKDLSENERNAVHAALNEEKDIFKIVVMISQAQPMKSLKGLLVTERLAKNGSVICVRPALDDLDIETDSDVPVEVLYGSVIDEREIRGVLSIDGIRVESIERFDRHDFDQPAVPVASEQSQPLPAPHAPDKGVQQTEEKRGGSKMVEQIAVKKEAGESKSGPIEISTIRIDSRKLDKLMNLSGELVTLRAQFARLLSLCEHDVNEQKEIANILKRMRGLSDETVKKDFINLTGETLTVSERSRRVLEELNGNLQEIDKRLGKGDIVVRIHELDELTSFLGKISSDIQSGVMQTRMIPIEGVFTRFKRMVRDISKELGKEVNLVIEGEDTELDKKIVDSLGDPLTHMVRNAIDHGLDLPEERRKLGKPEKGTVFLRASHRGNSICIEIGDDGRGMDAEKLVKKALEKGIITEEQAERLSEKEKWGLIFLPGFSTAEKVTGLSGRGVGMDVVKNMITAVNGVVDIDTELTKGTTFALMIPLTLAIIQALLVVINGETYAFPLELVTEIIKVTQDEIYSVDGNDTVKLRGHALSLIDLSTVIGLPGARAAATGSRKVVVVTDGTSQIGVVVDSLIGEDEIVIKSLTDHFSKVIGVSGASILGDGSVALILDPIAIINAAK